MRIHPFAHLHFIAGAIRIGTGLDLIFLAEADCWRTCSNCALINSRSVRAPFCAVFMAGDIVPYLCCVARLAGSLRSRGSVIPKSSATSRAKRNKKLSGASGLGPSPSSYRLLHRFAGRPACFKARSTSERKSVAPPRHLIRRACRRRRRNEGSQVRVRGRQQVARGFRSTALPVHQNGQTYVGRDHGPYPE